MATEIKTTGPLFDGRARAAISAFLDDAAETIAQEGVNDVRGMLDSVLKNPTGRYERGIRTDIVDGNRATTDSRIVYGPWLEGVSSRNQSSRFKGYFTFRTITVTLNKKAENIAERQLRPYLRRMG